MSDQCIIFSPERNQWTLADGWHHMEVPEWAREIMRDEFERETRPLHDSLDLALDSKRIAERRVTELLDENAKLRKLVRDYEHCSMHADCDSCKYDGTTSTHCPFSPGFPDIDELHELGVEVDG